MNTALQRLADRVDRNVPQHNRPEAFHEEKSEIVGELRRMARQEALSGVETVTDLLFVKGEIEHGVTMDEVRNPERVHDR